MKPPLRAYKKGDEATRLDLINRYLMRLNLRDFNDFIICIGRSSYFKIYQHLGEILSGHTPRLHRAINVLLKNRVDRYADEQCLKCGAYLVRTLVEQIDYRFCVPLLINAYQPEDYRDARYAIAMALAHISTQYGRDAIQLILLESEKRGDIQGEMLSHAQRYTFETLWRG